MRDTTEPAQTAPTVCPYEGIRVILPQTRLLERLIASEPRLVRLWAPAGYGKSSLARLFARRFDRHAICDCAGVCDPVEFADRAIDLAKVRLPFLFDEASTAAGTRILAARL